MENVRVPTKHAVLFEDNRLNADVLSFLLKAENVHCTVIDIPIEVEHRLEALLPIDVVFLDLELPEIDGYEVIKIIRAIPQLSEVPVIAYSVHLNEANLAHEAGFNGFLGKPIKAHQFPDQLRRILSGEFVWDV